MGEAGRRLEYYPQEEGEALLSNFDFSWQDEARCKGRSSTVFYPQRGVPTASARALCKECPVKRECLEYALAADERFGIWGGLSERERRKLQRERKRAAAAVAVKAAS